MERFLPASRFASPTTSRVCGEPSQEVTAPSVPRVPEKVLPVHASDTLVTRRGQSIEAAIKALPIKVPY